MERINRLLGMCPQSIGVNAADQAWDFQGLSLGGWHTLTLRSRHLKHDCCGRILVLESGGIFPCNGRLFEKNAKVAIADLMDPHQPLNLGDHLEYPLL